MLKMPVLREISLYKSWGNINLNMVETLKYVIQHDQALLRRPRVALALPDPTGPDDPGTPHYLEENVLTLIKGVRDICKIQRSWPSILKALFLFYFF